MTPWIVGAAAVGAAYGGYSYLGKPVSVPAAKDAAKAEADKVTSESSAPTATIKTFAGGDQGFVDLKLTSVEKYNHNTNKFRFELPDKDAVSGLHVACKLFWTS